MNKELFDKIVSRLENIIGIHHGKRRFDASSYDYMDDFPHIIVGGERMNVKTVSMHSSSREIIIELEEGYEYSRLIIEKTTFDPCQSTEIDPNSLYELFKEVFYNLPESSQFMDFEQFIGE